MVVPVLNEARLAERLACQLAPLPEVVIVDGGSSDGTREILKQFRVIEAPRGRARQMNAGARACRAENILFLHADTRLPENALRAAERAIGGGAVGGCFRLRIDSRDPRLKAAAHIINWRSRLMPSATGDQAIFVARDAFERIGGFREIALCEDLDLVARLKKLGRFECVDAYAETSARRWEEGGVTRTIVKMWSLRLGWHLGVAPDTLRRWYKDVR